MSSFFSDHLPSGLFISDADGKVIHVNERWCEMAGISAEEAKGEGWRKAIHPDDLDQLTQQWTAAVKSGQTFSSEHRFLWPDGREVWIEAEGYPIDSVELGKAAYFGTCTDITLRHQNEAQLRLYETLLSSNPDFAYVFNTDRRFIYANQSLLTMWGRTWQECSGKSLRELGYPEWHADTHLLGRAADDVGGEAQAGLLDQLDQADHVGDLRAGHPALRVHGEARERGAPADGLEADVLTEAPRTHRPRRVDVPAARVATRDLEPSGMGCAPRYDRRGAPPDRR